jgi:hypothetical protein
VTALEALPSQVAGLTARTAAVESQIVQLRGEMHVEFSAVRREMHDGFVAVTTELGGQILRLDRKVDGLNRKIDESSSQSRALFEEVIDRLKAISEGRTSP